MLIQCGDWDPEIASSDMKSECEPRPRSSGPLPNRMTSFCKVSTDPSSDNRENNPYTLFMSPSPKDFRNHPCLFQIGLFTVRTTLTECLMFKTLPSIIKTYCWLFEGDERALIKQLFLPFLFYFEPPGNRESLRNVL